MMRGAAATPEEQELLSTLHARMCSRCASLSLQPRRPHLYEKGIMDIDQRDGTTIYGIPVWFPKAEAESWEEARFKPRWHEIGRA